MKVIRFLTIATLVIAPMLATSTRGLAEPSPAAASSPAMPQNWDSAIPLPKGAVLISSTVPKVGVVHSADFSVPGNYTDLVSFYEKELPKAGFAMGPKVAFPPRKVYNRTFINGDMLDSVVVSPDPKDPSRFNVHIAWAPDAAPKSKSKAP